MASKLLLRLLACVFASVALANIAFGFVSPLRIEYWLQGSPKRVLEDSARNRQVQELVRSGTPAYGGTNLTWYMRAKRFPETPRLIYNGEEKLPISGLPRQTEVGIPEVGNQLVFKCDSFGFRNPESIWKQKQIRLALLGDSFALGSGSAAGNTLADFLREKIPSLMNLGQVALGPLTELAAYREYAEPFSPDSVVWLYYEGNDLANIAWEAQDNVLSRYLTDPDFEQGFLHNASMSSQLISEVIRVADARLRTSAGWFRAFPWSFRGFFLLGNLETILQITGWRTAPSLSVPERLHTFEEILEQLLQRQRNHRHRVLFVYLPAASRFSTPAYFGTFKSQVLAMTKDLGIPTIDGEEVFRQAASDPYSHFNLGKEASDGTHYNAQGNRALAAAILKAL